MTFFSPDLQVQQLWRIGKNWDLGKQAVLHFPWKSAIVAALPDPCSLECFEKLPFPGHPQSLDWIFIWEGFKSSWCSFVVTLSILCLQGLASQFGELDVGCVCCWRAGREHLSPILLPTCAPRICRGTELPLQPPVCPFHKLGALRVTELLFSFQWYLF